MKIRSIARNLAFTLAAAAMVTTSLTATAASPRRTAWAHAPVTLTWYMWCGSPQEATAWLYDASLVHKKYPWITVKFVTDAWPNYWVKLPPEMATGSLPDIVSLQSLRTANFGSAVMPVTSQTGSYLGHGLATRVRGLTPRRSARTYCAFGSGSWPFYHFHASVRLIARWIFRMAPWSRIMRAKPSSVNDCAPSLAAFSGHGCASTIMPSAPIATAALATGGTRLRFPVAWLGSSTTGKWVSSFKTGTAAISKVFRVAVSHVRMPRSHSMTFELPSDRMYSAAIMNSSSLVDIPRFSRIGLRERPARRSSEKEEVAAIMPGVRVLIASMDREAEVAEVRGKEAVLRVGALSIRRVANGPGMEVEASVPRAQLASTPVFVASEASVSAVHTQRVQ